MFTLPTEAVTQIRPDITPQEQITENLQDPQITDQEILAIHKTVPTSLLEAFQYYRGRTISLRMLKISDLQTDKEQR